MGKGGGLIRWEELREASGLHGGFVYTLLIFPSPFLFFFLFLFFFFFKGVFLAGRNEQHAGSLDAGHAGADGVRASPAAVPAQTPPS